MNFRQSCIYGYRQFGVEDQGWVAWFTIAHELRQPVTIYGTGKQVRDILFIDDLVDCYLAAIDRIDQVAGMTFNIGGGPKNTLSLLELLELLQQYSGREVVHSFEDWRPGDQPVYVSDIAKARQFLDWQPKIDVIEGHVLTAGRRRSRYRCTLRRRGSFSSSSAFIRDDMSMITSAPARSTPSLSFSIRPCTLRTRSRSARREYSRMRPRETATEYQPDALQYRSVWACTPSMRAATLMMNAGSSWPSFCMRRRSYAMSLRGQT